MTTSILILEERQGQASLSLSLSFFVSKMRILLPR